MKSPLIAALAALAALLLTAAPAAAAVTVSPAPGTPTASYKTQISIRGVAPSQIGTVRVVGSRSGNHRGRLRAHSDGKGASFVPAKDFRRGESVAVSTSLDIAGAKRGDYRFKAVGIGNASLVLAAPPFSNLGPGVRERYRTRRDLAPPATNIQTRRAGRAPGLIFINGRNRTGRGQQGPMIVDDNGELVFFRAVGNRKKAADTRVQQLDGKPVLTWWEGLARQGAGSGEGVILDTAYNEVARVRAGNGYRIDLHEFQLTPQGTALITVYNPLARDLSGIKGPANGRVVDSIVQEIDVKTGLVLFEWHSIGKVALTEAYSQPFPSPMIPFDYFHINSIAPDTDGNLLISARGTWAIYKIDRQSGRIIWRLNGKKSDFKMGPGTAFAWQHDAERRADGTLSLFDNSAAPPVRKRSRAITLALDEKAGTAKLVQSLEHPRNLLAANQGSFQELPNGNVMVGWGSQRAFSEFTPAGRMVLDGRISAANDSYRAYRFPWVAQPDDAKPGIAVEARGSGRSAVYSSFHGATEVATWEVLAGRTSGSLAAVGKGRKTGFETGLSVPSAGPFFAVRALDAAGKVLGTSKTVRR